MTRTIFFDIGNVLVFFSYEKMLKQLSEICGIDPLVIRREIEMIGPLYEEGTISSEELWRYFSKIATKNHSQKDFFEAMTTIFQENPSIYPIVNALKNKGFQLILISNTCEAHYDFLKETFPVINQFDMSVLSHKVNVRKPNKLIYEAALAVAECSSEDCFYTDDILEYVLAARALGIDAEPYTDTFSLIQHLKKRGLLNT